MFRKYVWLLAALLYCYSPAKAQVDTASHLRISLLTCGTGPEMWETFGHTAVRVTDTAAGTDIVYNYGTFSFSDDFAIQFMRGKLLYYVSAYPYNIFLNEYVEAGRSVQEQLLVLNDQQKKYVSEFLQTNLLPENRAYKYDFRYDNCATRIRDIFPKTLGNTFRFGEGMPNTKPLTFRNVTDRYLYANHWERFGINLLLGSAMEKVMTNEETMFLPDFLREGIGGSTVNGRPVTEKPVTILEGKPMAPAGPNWPMLVMSFIALLTIAGLLVPGWQKLGNAMAVLLLFVTGLLGCFMVFMWLGTDHQACRYNYNVLWALPTNLILAFTYKKGKDRYAIVAILLMLVALVLHVLHVQELPLLQIGPLLLALLFIYGMIYKRSKQPTPQL